MKKTALLTTAMLMFAWASGDAFAQAQEAFTDHGVGAQASRSRGATATVDGDGNRIVLVWMSDHRGTASKLIIDATTGETEQLSFERPHRDSPFSVLHSSRNLWYSQFANRFYEFDPSTRRFSFIGETPEPGMPGAMSMHEDKNGVIWSGLFPNANLLSYDPETRELVDHGRINEESWNQYLRSMAIDETGWVYVGIGTTRGQVAGYHPKTGEIRHYIPGQDRQRGTGQVRLGADGKVYANASGGWGWHVLYDGVATPIEDMPVAAVSQRTGHQGSVFAEFPDGSRIAELNIPDRILVIEDADGSRRNVDFDYQSEGSSIYTIVHGADNALYGSTGHPLRVWRFDLDSGELTHKGLLGRNGHLNQMTRQGELIYAGEYAGGQLQEFDVTKPWNPGTETGSNPLELGRARPNIIRPHVLLSHPDGRHVIMGGTPAYGHTGGGMYIYDTTARKDTVIPHTELLENHSIFALVALPNGDLVGGTTIAAGTGGERLASQAELFVFDWERREVVWRRAIIPGVPSLNDLVVGPDGLVYGMAAGSTFFVFDPRAREVVHEESLADYGAPAGSQAPRIMVPGADGNVIYVLFQRAIVELTPVTFQHRKLADTPVPVGAGIVLHKGRIYFSSSSRLWSYQLP